MWNPFKAVGNAIAGAGKAVGGGIGKAVGGIGKAVGGGLSKVGGGLSKAGDKLSGKSAPKAPPAPPSAPPQRRVTIPIERPAPPSPASTKKLPPSMAGGARPGAGPGGGMARDDAILGADSDADRALQEAIKEFEADHNILGLDKNARDFLAHPSFAAIFDQYAGPSGFSPEQWLNGMSNARNIQIVRTGDQIKIIFDGDFEIGDYDLGGRSPYATF